MPRICKRCSEEIPDTKRKDAIYCSNLCGNSVRGKRHKENNKEKYREKAKKESENKPKQLYTRIKSRCKKKQIPFNIDVSDLSIPLICPVLSIPIYWVEGGGTNQYNSPSVDRIIPEKGYVKGNVRVISNRANLLKSNATVEELTLVLEDLKCVSL